MLCPKEPYQNIPSFVQKEKERVFAKKNFYPSHSHDKTFSFVMRIPFSSYRCPEWQISLATFAKARRQEEKQPLLSDADQIIPLLFSNAFGHTNPFCWKSEYVASSYKLLLATIFCSEEVLA